MFLERICTITVNRCLTIAFSGIYSLLWKIRGLNDVINTKNKRRQRQVRIKRETDVLSENIMDVINSSRKE